MIVFFFFFFFFFFSISVIDGIVTSVFNRSYRLTLYMTSARARGQ